MVVWVFSISSGVSLVKLLFGIFIHMIILLSWLYGLIPLSITDCHWREFGWTKIQVIPAKQGSLFWTKNLLSY